MSPSTPALSTSANHVVRILPPEEWPRVREIEPFKSRGLPASDSNWMILVVERDGQIVGSCSLFTAMHWDCWYLDPTLHGAVRGVLLRQLLACALEILQQVAVTQVYTGVEPSRTGKGAEMLRRFGFKPAAGQLFVLDTADAAVALKAPPLQERI